MEQVLEAMRGNKGDAVVQEAGCQVLGTWGLEPKGCSAIAAAGGMRVVLTALQGHRTRPALQSLSSVHSSGRRPGLREGQFSSKQLFYSSISISKRSSWTGLVCGRVTWQCKARGAWLSGSLGPTSAIVRPLRRSGR